MKKIITTALLILTSLAPTLSFSDEVSCMALDCVKTTSFQFQQDVEAFHSELAKENIRFYLIERKLKLEIKSEDLFTDINTQSNLKDGVDDKISIINNFVKKYPNATVGFVGHTDAPISLSESMELTQYQVNAVADIYKKRSSSSNKINIIHKGNTDNDYCSEMNQGCNNKIDVWIENLY